MLLGAGVSPALEFGTPADGDSLFNGVTLDEACPGLLKKPAKVCCFGPLFCDDRPPVFLGAMRGVAISLPSIPRGMLSLVFGSLTLNRGSSEWRKVVDV